MAFPRVPARARHDGGENLFDQAPSLAHLWRVPLTRTLVFERNFSKIRVVVIEISSMVWVGFRIISIAVGAGGTQTNSRPAYMS